MSDHGYIVVRRDGDNGNPLLAGDVVDVYRLLAPLPNVTAEKPHPGHDKALLEYTESVLPDVGLAECWREQRAVYCPKCLPRQRKIVSLMIHVPAARQWVSPRGERTAPGVGARAPEAWPLHGNEGEAPHVGCVLSCAGCHSRWLVLSTHDDVNLVEVEMERYGSTVRP